LEQVLKNKQLLITRLLNSSDEAFKLLRSAGADIINFPTIKISLLKDNSAFIDMIRNINEFDYLIFTSQNAVINYAVILSTNNMKVNYSNLKVIVSGKKTSGECARLNIPVDLIPRKYSAAGIFEMLLKTNIKNKKFLLPCSAIARDELQIKLSTRDADVKMVPIYDALAVGKKELTTQLNRIKEKKPDIFVFTSPSTFNNFLSVVEIKNEEEYFRSSTIATIGTTTAAAINKHNIEVSIIPKISTLKNLAQSIIDYFSGYKAVKI